MKRNNIYYFQNIRIYCRFLLVFLFISTSYMQSQWNDHYYHTNPYTGRCVLNVSDTFETTDFQKFTNLYRICQYHITALRGHNSDYANEFLVPNTQGSDNRLRGASIGYSDKYKINMTLPKKTYKKFEPVIAKFDVINSDDKPLNIYNLFNASLKETDIVITDDIGNKYDINKHVLDILTSTNKPTYIIEPGETLSVSMPINNWGAILERNEWCFDQFGYFPPRRKYKAYLYVDRTNHEFKGVELKSNDVEFDVVDLDIQDAELLNLKDYNIEEILTKFSDNVFTEHIFVWHLRKYWLYMWGEKFDSENLLKDYENFVNKYPDSYYLLQRRLIAPYFMKLAKRNIDRIDEAISGVKENNTNSLLFNLLNSEVIVQSIEEMLKDYINASEIIDK